MAHDTILQDQRDRDRVADLGYEAEHIAKTTGITRYNAFRLIKRYGKDREALVRAAGMLKTGATAATTAISCPPNLHRT
jgi:hypothetical protein